jgi:hypothetical protein
MKMMGDANGDADRYGDAWASKVMRIISEGEMYDDRHRLIVRIVMETEGVEILVGEFEAQTKLMRLA